MTVCFSFLNFLVSLRRKYESTDLEDSYYRAEFWALFGCSCEGCGSLNDIDVLTRDDFKSSRLTVQHYYNQFKDRTDCSDGDNSSVGLILMVMMKERLLEAAIHFVQLTQGAKDMTQIAIIFEKLLIKVRYRIRLLELMKLYVKLWMPWGTDD